MDEFHEIGKITIFFSPQFEDAIALVRILELMTMANMKNALHLLRAEK